VVACRVCAEGPHARNTPHSAVPPRLWSTAVSSTARPMISPAPAPYAGRAPEMVDGSGILFRRLGVLRRRRVQDGPVERRVTWLRWRSPVAPPPPGGTRGHGTARAGLGGAPRRATMNASWLSSGEETTTTGRLKKRRAQMSPPSRIARTKNSPRVRWTSAAWPPHVVAPGRTGISRNVVMSPSARTDTVGAIASGLPRGARACQQARLAGLK